MYKKPFKNKGLRKKPSPPVITAEQFRDARVFGGFSREEVAEFLGVSRRTIGHWETGNARVPYSAFKLLRVYRHGDLIDPAWSQWKISKGMLWTPEGRAIGPHEGQWLGLLVARANLSADLAREVQKLKSRVSELMAMGTVDGVATERSDGAATAAGAIGLVYSKTSDTAAGSAFSIQWLAMDRTSCSGPIMGPKWGHERYSPTGSPEAQSPVASGSSPTATDLRGRDGRIAQCGMPAGAPQFPPVRYEVSPRPSVAPFKADAAKLTQVSPAAKANRTRFASAGWAQRSVPLQQWQKGQALPPGVDLTGGDS